MKLVKLCIFITLILATLPVPLVASSVTVSWNGTAWAVLDENGSHLTIVTSDQDVLMFSLRVNGTPCGLTWNGSEWLVETFIPDKIIVQTLNGSHIFHVHSYDCRGFAYINGTYHVPISESAMMGDCSLLLISPNGSIKGTIPCGFINSVRVKAIEGKLYFMNCTGVYVYSNGRFEQVHQLNDCADGFGFLRDKLLLCSGGLTEVSKNGEREVLNACDAIGCNDRECLIVANKTLYIYDGRLRKLETEKIPDSSASVLMKALTLSALVVLLASVILLRKRLF